MEGELNRKLVEVELRVLKTINVAIKKNEGIDGSERDMVVVRQLQEKQGDVLVAMEPSVHELTMQNVEEVKEE